jgi:hypothetical protein
MYSGGGHGRMRRYPASLCLSLVIFVRAPRAAIEFVNKETANDERLAEQ